MATSAAGLRRPVTVTAAALLTVFVNLASIPFLFAPGADDIPGAVIALGLAAMVVTFIGVWAMWHGRRWGAILTFVLTLLSLLSSIPGFFEPPSGWILAELIGLTPFAIAALVLIAHPTSRRAYR
jgi:hypothetical protein